MATLDNISIIFKKIVGSSRGLLKNSNRYYSCQNHHAEVDSINYSKLLSYHFKVGRVEDAEKLFDEMPVKNVVSWSIMIHGYAKNGFHRESLECFSQMRNLVEVPNSFTMVGVVVGIVGFRDLLLGQSVHGLIIKTGLESNLIVGTAMLDAYARCGNVNDSCKLFEGLKNPGLISCNAVIAGFIHNGLFEEAVTQFKQFWQFGLVPNAVTVVTLFQGCVALESKKLCESIHGLVVKLCLVSDISVNNSVLDMYSSFMDLDAATKIFDEMETKDIISLTTFMGLLISLEHATDALKLFSHMKHSGVGYDSVAFMNLVSACVILGDLQKGRQLHTQALIHGFGSELRLANSILAMYSKCGDLQSSMSVFYQTTEKSLASWTAMISGCMQNGQPKEALSLLIKIKENFCPDSIMLVSALTASGELAAFEHCKQLHCYAFTAGFPQYRLIQNSLITSYSKCGAVEFAHNVFKEMGCLQDRVSWNAIISGHGINGHGETAVALFHEMRKCGEDPDSATYLCILSACSHSALVDDGLMIFTKMVEESRVRPGKKHYGSVVDLLARAGCLSDASKLVSNFLEMIGPSVWMSLLNGCLLHGNIGLAEVAARKAFETDPEDPDQVALVSNVYASVGRFQDAETFRMSMEKKWMIKNPGISLLSGISYDYG